MTMVTEALDRQRIDDALVSAISLIRAFTGDDVGRVACEELEHARRALSATGDGAGWQVKELEWEGPYDMILYAELYRIEDHGTNWSTDRYWLYKNGAWRGKFETCAEAKAAAQRDYEFRIRSAVVSAPAEGVFVPLDEAAKFA